MSTLSIPNSFNPGDNADASLVNANFSAIATYVNGQCIVKDASVAFTAVPSGPSSDTITANQLARKQYIDQHDTSTSQLIMNNNTNVNATKTTLGTILVTDPGYDIDMWALGSTIVSPQTTADLTNMWELGIQFNGTQVAGFRIPVIVAQQSLSTGGSRVVTLTTGTGTGTAGAHKVEITTVRVNGSQTQMFIFPLDARYTYLQVWYRRH